MKSAKYRARKGRPEYGQPWRFPVLDINEWEREFFPLLVDHLVAEVNQEHPTKVVKDKCRHTQVLGKTKTPATVNKRAQVAHQKLGLWYERATGRKPGASHKSADKRDGLACSFRTHGPYIRTLQKLFNKLGIKRQAFSYIQRGYGGHEPDPASALIEMIRFRRMLGPRTLEDDASLRSMITSAVRAGATTKEPRSK